MKPSRTSKHLISIVFPVTIFSSAFLLFQVQPVISKFILPWFGGTPSVWTTALVFFQVVLCLGYGYAHWLTESNPPKRQALIHSTLLLSSLVLLPITPDPSWKPTGAEEPLTLVLLILFSAVGLPYFLLATTNPLLQKWLVYAAPSSSPYRLYALSNLGSLLALLSFPFFIEPIWTSTEQTRYWSGGFTLFVGLTILSAIFIRRMPSPVSRPEQTSLPRVADSSSSAGKPILWFSLAACGVILLLSVTNFVCQDIAVVPFLWIIPLTLYLLSYILAFDSSRWYSRKVYLVLLTITALSVFSYSALNRIGISVSSFFALFFCCMICHGELARLKPAPSLLTRYYLMLSLGGACGGLFVGIIAPLIFIHHVELALGFILTAYLIVLVNLQREKFWSSSSPKSRLARFGTVALLFLLVIGAAVVDRMKISLFIARNFFGIITVVELDKENASDHRYVLFHGRVNHGFQYQAPPKRSRPTAYFGPKTGAGLSLLYHPKVTNRKIGVLGLGAGTLAVYGKPGDKIKFYEINPDVVDVANSLFTYLKDSQAEVQVIPGDGRLALEGETANSFDILVLDAFSGGAVPVHLLTKEAFDLYLGHLNHDGIIVANISNAYVNLVPVLKAIADKMNLEFQQTVQFGELEPGLFPSHYVLLTTNREFLERTEVKQELIKPTSSDVSPVLWTDNFSNLISVIKFGRP